jgi:predicted ArsR family transcriptional regulator
MQETRQRITNLLKNDGGLTTDELSALLGISATAVRRHLAALEAQNIVCHRSEQRGNGRPSYVYQLKANGPDVFAQSYTAFAFSIVKELTELGGDKRPHELFDQRQERRHHKYINLTKGEKLTDRVASLARLMEREGRMTTWQQLNESRFILREHNCPFYRLAARFDYPCHCEISLLRETLKADVKRVNHILKGDVACVYEIDGSNGHHEEHEIAPQWMIRRGHVPSELFAGQTYAHG